MHLSDLLHPRRVLLPLDAKDKPSALRALSVAFADDAALEGRTLSPEHVLEGLKRREALGTTGTGSGVAIPHCRIAAAPDTRAVVAIHRSGIAFDAIDGEPVRLLLGLVGPRSDPATHLRVLASIGRALRDERGMTLIPPFDHDDVIAGRGTVALELFDEVPDLDLLVVDSEGDHAAHALFWFDPTTSIGVVEPVRTVDAHQQRGLSRHLLTAGLARLAALGAERVSIGYEPDNPASGHLYRSVGWVPGSATDLWSCPTA